MGNPAENTVAESDVRVTAGEVPYSEEGEENGRPGIPEVIPDPGQRLRAPLMERSWLRFEASCHQRRLGAAGMHANCSLISYRFLLIYAGGLGGNLEVVKTYVF